jgi:hypothetical protein
MLAARMLAAASAVGNIDFALDAPDLSVFAAYRGDSLIDGGGGLASAWNDRVGSFHMTAFNDPVIQAFSGFNNRLGALLDGIDQYFSVAAASRSQPLSAFIVCEATKADASNKRLLNGSTNGSGDEISSLWTSSELVAISAPQIVGTSGNDVPLSIECYWDGTSSALRVGNVLEATGDSDSTITNGWVVGQSGLGNNYFGGRVLELVLADGAASAADRQLWEDYNGQYYGLSF